MAEKSKISWTDRTFNPWMGCTRVSEACRNCYAETLMDTRWGKVEWGPRGTRVRTSLAYWQKPLAWDAQAELEGRPSTVFCASLADVYEDESTVHVADEYDTIRQARQDLWKLIGKTGNLRWLLLTKRPENIGRMLPPPLASADHVWHGVTVESQEHLSRFEMLVDEVRPDRTFLSVEPQLGELDLEGLTERPAWVISGGESGKGARLLDLTAVWSLYRQCEKLGIPFFFKQFGDVIASEYEQFSGAAKDPAEWAELFKGIPYPPYLVQEFPW